MAKGRVKLNEFTTKDRENLTRYELPIKVNEQIWM